MYVTFTILVNSGHTHFKSQEPVWLVAAILENIVLPKFIRNVFSVMTVHIQFYSDI